MGKFMIVYRSSATAGEQMANAEPGAAQAAMEEWGKWMGKVGGALADIGAPLNEASVVGSGSGTHIGGYTILTADSADEVKKLVEDHPHVHSPDANIQVLEVLPIPGM